MKCILTTKIRLEPRQLKRLAKIVCISKIEPISEYEKEKQLLLIKENEAVLWSLYMRKM